MAHVPLQILMYLNPLIIESELVRLKVYCASVDPDLELNLFCLFPGF